MKAVEEKENKIERDEAGPEEILIISEADKVKNIYKTKRTDSGRELQHKKLAHVNHAAI